MTSEDIKHQLIIIPPPPYPLRPLLPVPQAVRFLWTLSTMFTSVLTASIARCDDRRDSSVMSKHGRPATTVTEWHSHYWLPAQVLLVPLPRASRLWLKFALFSRVAFHRDYELLGIAGDLSLDVHLRRLSHISLSSDGLSLLQMLLQLRHSILRDHKLWTVVI